MPSRTIWQYGSSSLENADNFAVISQWWQQLNGREVTWQQRLIPPMGDVSELNWDPQRFDEKFVMTTPEIRGITLYWRKPEATDERNITIQKLELDTLRQQLYAFPQSQKDVVLRIALPEVVYQKLEVRHPKVEVGAQATDYVLTLRDTAQRLDIKVVLSQDELMQMKQQLSQFG